MGQVNAKSLLVQAKQDEKEGRKKEASAKYASIGIQLRKNHRYGDAKTFLERAVKLSKTSARLYLHLAMCEAAMGEEEDAKRSVARFAKLALRKGRIPDYSAYLEKHCQDYPGVRKQFYLQLLEVDRTQATPFLGIASAYEQLGETRRAIKYLEDALKAKTHTDEVLAALRRVLDSAGLTEELKALKRYEQGALSLEDFCLLLSGSQLPKQAEPSESIRFEKSQADHEEKDLDRLITELEEAVGINESSRMEHDSVSPLVKEFRKRSAKVLEGDSKARIDMAMAFFEMGLVEDAQDELKPVRETDPYYLQAQLVQGEIYFHEKSFLEALSVFQSILRDDRLDLGMEIETRYKIALVYQRLGDVKQALNFATQVESKDPQYRDVRHLLSHLKASLSEADKGLVFKK